MSDVTNDERDLVQRAFMHGPSALFERGYDNKAVHDFLSRPEIVSEFEIMLREFGHQDTLFALIEFGLKRKLARLGPNAVDTLGQALAGPIYARDGDGNILTDSKNRPIIQEAAPTPEQVYAASQILDRVGVRGDKKRDAVPRDAQVLFSKEDSSDVKLVADESNVTTEQQALSRERMRNAMERVAEKIPKAKVKIDRMLGTGNGKQPTKKKKPASKAK
jgi:hypothetical protein